MKYDLIVYIILLFAGVTACSESAKSNGEDTGDSSGNTDTSSETAVTDSGNNSDSTADTNSSTSAYTDSNSNTDADTGTHTYGDTYTDSNTDTDTDTDSDTDTDADTGIAADTGTEPVYTNCASNGEIRCYGDDIWCFVGDEPVEMVSLCEEKMPCTILSSGGAQCQCIPDVRTGCYNNDVWTYDSCGNFGRRAEDCAEYERCQSVMDDIFHCVACEDYCVGTECDECPVDTDSEECTDCDTDTDVDTGIPQCPTDKNLLQPDHSKCWTCPIGEGGVRACDGSIGKMLYQDAVNSCPDGFSLPTPDDLATLFDEGNFTVGEGKYEGGAYVNPAFFVEGDCSLQTVCGQLFQPLLDAYIGRGGKIWTSTPCVLSVDEDDIYIEGYVAFSLRWEHPEAGYYSDCIEFAPTFEDPTLLGALTVCVKDIQ